MSNLDSGCALRDRWPQSVATLRCYRRGQLCPLPQTPLSTLRPARNGERCGSNGAMLPGTRRGRDRKVAARTMMRCSSLLLLDPRLRIAVNGWLRAFTQTCARWSVSRRWGTPDRAAERVAPTWPAWASDHRFPAAQRTAAIRRRPRGRHRLDHLPARPAPRAPPRPANGATPARRQRRTLARPPTQRLPTRPQRYRATTRNLLQLGGTSPTPPAASPCASNDPSPPRSPEHLPGDFRAITDHDQHSTVAATLPDV